MSLQDWFKIAASGGAGLAFIVGMLFVKGWVVPGYLYREKSEDCAKWERWFLESLKITRRSTEVMQESVEVARIAATTATTVATSNQQPIDRKE